MSTPSPAVLIAEAKTLVETYLPDTCSIYEPAEVDIPGGGFESSDGTAIESGIKCLLEAESDSDAIVAGASRGVVIQKLFLEVTDNTKLIKPSQVIVVDAREGKPQMRFLQPKRLDESFEVLITIGAVVASQGN